MRRAILTFLIIAGVSVALRAQAPAADATPQSSTPASDFMQGVRNAIERYMGRPYVWGATGLKSFDCSGFVWRVLRDNGVFIKRTTARKLYMMTKPAPKEARGTFGTLVFFDDLKHIGIIDSPNSFYHSQTSIGTNRSEMNAFWRQKIYGYRQLPIPQ